jgi:AhpC/TSA family
MAAGADMNKLFTFAVVAILTASALVWSATPVPRPSPELAIAVPGGSTMQLSSLRGKVVVLEFLFVKSQHCLRVASMLNELHGEAALRGFQPVGLVFDPPNANSHGELVPAMVDYFKLTYPVGYASKDVVDTYLGRSSNETLNIPQLVVIDRAGTIRAVSGGRGGNPTLEDAASLRKLIATLLEEGR